MGLLQRQLDDPRIGPEHRNILERMQEALGYTMRLVGSTYPDVPQRQPIEIMPETRALDTRVQDVNRNEVIETRNNWSENRNAMQSINQARITQPVRNTSLGNDVTPHSEILEDANSKIAFNALEILPSSLYHLIHCKNLQYLDLSYLQDSQDTFIPELSNF